LRRVIDVDGCDNNASSAEAETMVREGDVRVLGAWV